MHKSSLEKFIESVRQNWQGLNTNSVLKCRSLLVDLAKTSADEPWLAQIHAQRPASIELYSDTDWGFKLLAHTEPQGLYRAPHDHGEGWVLYAPQYGELEITTYKQITARNGQTNLIGRGAEILTAGQCKVYLPRDIHDTRCLSDYLVQFRFTSCDFKLEKQQGRMIEFASTSI
ncbi:hypothetical protein [Paraglaciecola hydrolytica]|uniref:Cysteine dioxygenase n=1 Tax=Paraglaciecola hydrolytica TaxID=1799789 RepID=A0A136A5X1_9ALTE|nr:hypothetical protein [Paraglaciecola hydrolytica]KXI30606.1 hypothetical protein AX660_03970 [Paraglaciecola hydrolytica]